MIKIKLFLLFLLLTFLSQKENNAQVDAQQALIIAKKNIFLYSIKSKHLGWQLSSPQLDPAKKNWSLVFSKVHFRDWGRTTKNYPGDFRRPCRRVNGCHITKTKTLLIDAASGKLINSKKEKRVSGNYE